MKYNIYDYTLEELQSVLIEKGEKPFRATQIFEWLYRKRVNQFSDMTNLSQKTISMLEENFTATPLNIVTKQISKDGTIKYLFELADQRYIETVLMKHNYGNSVCVTSQVGCNMGCAFCASGELGKVRNLSLGEMVQQVWMVQKDLDEKYQRVSNIVVMGIGEPFDNYETVLRFLQVINYAKGLEIGARHITVSTCGIVPKIDAFATFDLQVNLAISLHAPNDEIRNQIMKINKRYGVSEIIEAVKRYIAKTNRRVTFQYIILKGINDSPSCANELAKLVQGINCYINLIPYNEVSTKPYQRTAKVDAEAFFEVLKQSGVQATLRMEHGGDIAAACGQLRAQKIKERCENIHE